MHPAGVAADLPAEPALAAPPRSLPAWLPVLWRRVLFPGTATADTRVRALSLLLVVALPAVLLYPCLSFHLFEPDEGRYAEIPREMLARADWVVPYLQGEPYLDKPPLLYWLVMGSYRLFGVHAWAARLVPALAVHGCVLLVYLLGRRALGERAALWGALLLALAPGFVSMGRLLVLDGLLAFWVALALFAGFEAVRGPRLRRGWWLLAAAACGLGVLTKGPVAVLLVVPPLWLHRRLAGPACRLSWAARLAFAAVTLAVAGPWYVAVCLRAPAFAGYFLWQHNVVRFLSPFDHLEPVWFYGPVVLAGLLPGTLWAVPFLRFLLTGRPEDVARRSPELGFALLAGGWGVFFFTLSGCKLPTYVLPAFPFLTLALGAYLAGGRWAGSRWPALVAGTAFVLLGVGHHVIVPWYAWNRSPVGRPEVVARYCGDRDTPVVCYPSHCDSVCFYLGRDDLRSFRSKQIDDLRQALTAAPRTVVLCTHRHALGGLREALPPELRLTHAAHFGLASIPGLPESWGQKITTWMGQTPLELCDVAVVERRGPGDGPPAE
jgi:4-amino-4-deoxy-L-arabinose transferase-like glycosyltransferase